MQFLKFWDYPKVNEQNEINQINLEIIESLNELDKTLFQSKYGHVQFGRAAIVKNYNFNYKELLNNVNDNDFVCMLNQSIMTQPDAEKMLQLHKMLEDDIWVNKIDEIGFQFIVTVLNKLN